MGLIYDNYCNVRMLFPASSVSSTTLETFHVTRARTRMYVLKYFGLIFIFASFNFPAEKQFLA